MFGIGQNKYIVVFLRKVNEIYDRVSQKKVKLGDKDVRYAKEKTWALDFSKIGYKKGTKHFIFIDIDSGGHLTFNAQTSPIPTDIIDGFVNRGVFKQIVSGLQTLKPSMMPLMVAVVIALAFTFIGYFFGNVYPMDAIQKAVGVK